MNKTELIKEMKLSLQEGNLNNAIGLMNRCYEDTLNNNIIELLNDNYITGNMIALISKNPYIKFEYNFEIDNSQYTYYKYEFKCNEGKIEIHTIKQLTKESVKDIINQLKEL